MVKILSLFLTNFNETGDYLLLYFFIGSFSISIIILGLISYQLTEGNVSLASQQLSFLRELSATIEPSPELSYLAAILAKKEAQPAETVLGNLRECIERIIQRVIRLPFSIAYLKIVNPDLVIKTVREFLNFAPREVQEHTAAKSLLQRMRLRLTF
jgi:hypothetical protein